MGLARVQLWQYIRGRWWKMETGIRVSTSFIFQLFALPFNFQKMIKMGRSINFDDLLLDFFLDILNSPHVAANLNELLVLRFRAAVTTINASVAGGFVAFVVR